MGFILDVPDDDFGIELRKESFYIRSSERRTRIQKDGMWVDGDPVRRFWAYPDEEFGPTIEIAYDDVMALIGALTRVVDQKSL